MVQKCPTSIGEIQSIPGVNDDKYNRYGAGFLEILKRYAPKLNHKAKVGKKSSTKSPFFNTGSSKAPKPTDSSHRISSMP